MKSALFFPPVFNILRLLGIGGKHVPLKYFLFNDDVF